MPIHTLGIPDGFDANGKSACRIGRWDGNRLPIERHTAHLYWPAQNTEERFDPIPREFVVLIDVQASS